MIFAFHGLKITRMGYLVDCLIKLKRWILSTSFF
jgi:hypothetical protein